MKAVLLAAPLLLLTPALPAQQPPPAPNSDAWKFLIGKWVGEGPRSERGINR